MKSNCYKVKVGDYTLPNEFTDLNNAMQEAIKMQAMYKRSNKNYNLEITKQETDADYEETLDM